MARADNPEDDGGGQALPLGGHDHQPFSAFSAQLVYGKKPNGEIVHISEVPSGAACACVCPACGAELVARRGRKMAHHFAHHRRGECEHAAETNAHLWAKDILLEVMRIDLPDVYDLQDGQSTLIHAGGLCRFDTVRSETRLGGIVPDLIVTRGDDELIVEVRVTHPCDEEKIRRIRQLGVSAIEVDLRAFRFSRDRRAIEHAFLHNAPRTWLYSRAIEQVQQDRREQARAEQRAAEDEARKLVADFQMPVQLPDDLAAEIRTARALGYDHCLGVGPEAWGFVVPMAAWQAAIIIRVLAPAAQSARTPINVASVLQKLDDLIHPELPRPLTDPLKSALQQAANAALPREAVEAYFDELRARDVLTEFHPHSGWGVGLDYEHGERIKLGIHRLKEAARCDRAARERLRNLVSGLSLEEKADFDLDAWISSVPGFDLSLSELCEDQLARSRFDVNLGAIEAMLRGGAPAQTLMGLPLEHRLARAREAAHQQKLLHEQQVRDQRQAEREARIRRLRILAKRQLGGAASEWLNQPNEDGFTPIDEAADSEISFNRVCVALDRLAERRRAAQSAAELIDGCRSQLTRAAQQRFGPDKPDHVAAFLNSSHPKLDRTAPLQYCRDERTLAACLRLLEQSRIR